MSQAVRLGREINRGVFLEMGPAGLFRTDKAGDQAGVGPPKVEVWF